MAPGLLTPAPAVPQPPLPPGLLGANLPGPGGGGGGGAPSGGAGLSSSQDALLEELSRKCAALERRERQFPAWLAACVLITILTQKPAWQRWLRKSTVPCLNAAIVHGRAALLALFVQPVHFMLIRPIQAIWGNPSSLIPPVEWMRIQAAGGVQGFDPNVVQPVPAADANPAMAGNAAPAQAVPPAHAPQQAAVAAAGAMPQGVQPIQVVLPGPAGVPALVPQPALFPVAPGPPAHLVAVIHAAHVAAMAVPPPALPPGPHVVLVSRPAPPRRRMRPVEQPAPPPLVEANAGAAFLVPPEAPAGLPAPHGAAGPLLPRRPVFPWQPLGPVPESVLGPWADAEPDKDVRAGPSTALQHATGASAGPSQVPGTADGPVAGPSHAPGPMDGAEAAGSSSDSDAAPGSSLALHAGGSASTPVAGPSHAAGEEPSLAPETGHSSMPAASGGILERGAGLQGTVDEDNNPPGAADAAAPGGAEPTAAAIAGGDVGCQSDAVSVASFRSDGGAGGLDGEGGGASGSGYGEDLDLAALGVEEDGIEFLEEGLEAAGDDDGSPDLYTVLGLPHCLGEQLLRHLDADAIRVLRLVCRSLYFEASRHVSSLVVTPGNLGILLAQPVHMLMPGLRALVFRGAPPAGATLLPSTTPGPQPPAAAHLPDGIAVPDVPVVPAFPSFEPAAMLGPAGAQLGPQAVAGPGAELPANAEAVAAPQAPPQGLLGSTPPRITPMFAATPQAAIQLMQFIQEVIPNLPQLEVVDLTEAPLHAMASVWAALLDALPSPTTRILLREHSAWARGAMGLLSTPEALRDSMDYFPEAFEAVKRAHRLNVGALPGLVDGRSSSRSSSNADPPRAFRIELAGITLRRNTASRLPQLCQLQCLTSLTLFGKSAAAVQHGHRLAGHLTAIANLKNLTRLELLSYEDVSDSELGPLAACPRLAHLYLDSLFIKQAVGPVFPAITSLTAARVKFILRPLTTIFPSLARLRLGVLHSELNKKISSASLSCLAGCGGQLGQLCVCPVLWKGQWQVLPTLPGLHTLQLVHCHDLGHLREVLHVVGRAPALARLELHATSPALPPWPGAAGDGDGGGGGGGDAGPAGLGGGEAGVAAMLAAPGGGADPPEAAGTMLRAGVYDGLAGLRGLHTLLLAECSGRLVRHLAAADLPGLHTLILRGMGAGVRLADLEVAVLALPALRRLELEGSGEFGAAPALGLPALLARPGLSVHWRATPSQPPLLFSRDCGGESLLPVV